ncbi:MAG TPA: DUF1566 domain-containing protein [bacterium]|nr:DUF1566 domain-containing protein [bacterium]
MHCFFVRPAKLVRACVFAFLFFAAGSLHAGNKPWAYIADATKRFVVLPEFYNLAVLDRSTGLIWTKEPHGAITHWTNAVSVCYINSVGAEPNGRHGIAGWRLPRPSELLSLLELRVSCSPGGCGASYELPAGHPFTLESNTLFWSSEPTLTDTASGEPGAWIVDVLGGGAIEHPREEDAGVWCVRG